MTMPARMLLFAAFLGLSALAQAERYTIPWFVPADSGGASQGVLRIVNGTGESGSAEIVAIDDAGARTGPISLELNPWTAVELTATELQSGNAAKGLASGLGRLAGDVRLLIDSDVAIVPSAYVRSGGGALAAVHDTVLEATEPGTYRYDVAIFHPAANAAQQSRLRLINPGGAAARVAIAARDDTGMAASGGTVELTLPAGGAQTLTAQQLEAGDPAVLTGRLGAGVGNWRLSVTSNLPIQAINVTESSGGEWNNLSTTAVTGWAPEDEASFEARFLERIIVSRDGLDRLELRVLAENRFRATVGLADGGEVIEEGGYRFERTGRDAGLLTLLYDNVPPCTVSFYFDSPISGWFAFGCIDLANAVEDWAGVGWWTLSPEGAPLDLGSRLEDLYYTVDTAIDVLTLPAASGGSGELTKSLSPEVPGLQFDVSTRELSGTPSEAGSWVMTYRVRDASGDSDWRYFNITVEAATGGGVPVEPGNDLASAAEVASDSDIEGDLTAGDVDYFRVVIDAPGTLEAYTSGRTDTLGKLEDADGSELSENDDGGSGTNFRISEDVSPGTYFVRVEGYNSRTAGDYTLHLRFTESSAESSTGTSPSFPAGSGPGNQTYNVGTAISALTLPEASGGDGPLTYSLTPSVPGLIFDATASLRRLTGTPTTAGTYNMTYTVRDVDGDTGSLTFAIAVENTGSGAMERSVPLLLSASDSSREGVVRVINRSTVGGTVAIRATDDSGWQAPEISLAINAQQARHFNSSDLESGNQEKGLTGSAGPPVQGDWRLEWSSELDIEVLAFVRTADGFLAPMHDAVPRAVRRHRVSTFYPGDDTGQVSKLRLINDHDEPAAVTIAGIDATGAMPESAVELILPARAARVLTAAELESGSADGLEGALGAGEAEWQLIVSSEPAIRVMNLLDNSTGHLSNLSTRPPLPAQAPLMEHSVPLFLSTSDSTRGSFVRVVNRSAVDGTVAIRAIDDSGWQAPDVTLAVKARHSTHFNSTDLESGNPEKGLVGSAGPPMQGDWRLELSSDLDIEVLAYARTAEGFLTAMHDSVPRAVERHRVSTFYPGGDTSQVSKLRLINDHDEPVAVTIEGIDATGSMPESAVELILPARTARMLTAAELESGSADGLEGALGAGEAEWQLIVSSEPAVRLMNLLDTSTGHLSNLSTRPPLVAEAPLSDLFAQYNNELEPKPWWKPSAPYSCLPAVNADSPWTEAGLPDLGGADPLSLIRWYGNGSYVRYGHMGFNGCTRLWKDPRETHLDTPADPTYYTALGDVEIHVDIARVPAGAPDVQDSERVDMTLEETVRLLNDHVAPYYRKLSQGAFRLSFLEGEDFIVPGDGSATEMQQKHREIQGIECDDYPCSHSSSGAANRLLFVDTPTGAGAWNGNIVMGLQFVANANMETIVHEIGHAWLFWPHSYAEVMWQPFRDGDVELIDPYSNRFDFMSSLYERNGWRQTLPATLAINRYAAGWIRPDEVALHLAESGTYTLRKPLDGGKQFLVVHSGRRYAFTTLEVTDDRDADYQWDASSIVYDPDAPFGFRSYRYEGVLVNRYDQTTGTGVQARSGPALFDRDNPNYLVDVGWGRDDHALIPDGESRDIGGVTVSVTRNPDGSYDVTLEGGRTAQFEQWCISRWFLPGQFDNGCSLDHPR